MAKQVQQCPTIIRVHYKHGDTPLVQMTHDPDAHCLACHWRRTRAESISLLAMAACAIQSRS